MSVIQEQRTIIHVIPDLGVGGAEAVLSQIVTAKADPSWRYIVATMLPGGYHASALRSAGIEVVELDFNTITGTIAGLLRITRLIREVKPKIVQGWMYYGDLVGLVASHLAGRRSKTCVIWTIRCSNMDFSWYRARLRVAVQLCRRLSSKPDMVVANSTAGLQVHRAIGYKPRHSAVIHNGVDVDRFRPDPVARAEVRAELGIPSSATVLAHVARLDPMKDHRNFLNAMAQLPEFHAILLGDGTETLAGPSNIHCLGLRSDVPRYLVAADFIVSSSAFGEGCSNVLLEAMACGLPAIATDVGDAVLLVNDAGVVVPPRDSDALAAAIRKMAAEPEHVRACRSARARKHIVSRFSVGSSVQQFTELYEALLQSGRASVSPPKRQG